MPARSRGCERLQVLLLIARIAQMAPRLIGEAAKAHQLELQFMSTNRTQRREIPVMTLARRVIDPPSLLRSLGDVSRLGAGHPCSNQQRGPRAPMLYIIRGETSEPGPFDFQWLMISVGKRWRE